MSEHNEFLSSFGLHTAIQPHDATGAASTGAWMSLKNAEDVTFVISKGAWAGGTPAVTIEQAQDVSGTNPKAVPFTQAWTKAATAGATWQPVVVTANTFNLVAAPNTLAAVTISAQQLDKNNAYTSLRVVIGTPGVNADLVSVLAIFRNERYQDYPSNLDSHLVD